MVFSPARESNQDRSIEQANPLCFTPAGPFSKSLTLAMSEPGKNLPGSESWRRRPDVEVRPSTGD
jgi:hypothetical protein